MRRVRHQFQVHSLVAGCADFAAKAHVVFNVTTAHGLVYSAGTFKLTEDLLIGFAHDIRQHVEAAAVRHTDHHFFHAFFGRLIDDGIQSRNGRFPAFERETFLSHIFCVQEFFKHHGLVDLFQDTFFLIQRNGIYKLAFHFVGEPIYFFLVADVFEFDTDMAGIAFLQMCEDIAERGGTQPDEVTGEKLFVHVFFGKTKKAQFEVGPAVAAVTDGIGISQQVSFVAIAQNQAVSTQFLLPIHTVASSECSAVNGSSVAFNALSNSKIKPFEKFAEVGVHTVGVFHKIIVQVFDKSRRRISDIRKVLHEGKIWVSIIRGTNIAENYRENN